MSPLAAAYDNIRLIRRKVDIAQGELEGLPIGSRRDDGIVRVAKLAEELVRAVQDFADMGYEEEVLRLLEDHSDFSQSKAGGMH
ncbi:hypothetical protein [Pseudooctadecabacter jejudonensis]|uniref:Uncharacterized protein n=1 Tax=Pseudooctadecabacter jejudonensis TaxID=1391910 RepID=A0A1Y5TBL7_9RHOB|nr:hypothetical protein [Pseudooctadecabacter jejudonensis]SLN58190.1 hypothetical protein PSJ8397_03054 [Pseudooctadecabacter jejudonensis]